MASTFQQAQQALSVAKLTDARQAILKLEDVSVRVRLQRERVDSLREYFIRLVKGKPISSDEFWPLRNISFEVDRGEVFGVIGQNGAGKSTLLRVIAGIIKPTTGRVEVHGRVAPLIELGAGFDPEMTGRENILLYGALLGFPTARLKKRLGHIISFAELEDFADVPLKNYSSGMAARLAFAIATDVDADLLLIDEVLSVGDMAFAKKCEERINEFRKRGVSIILVSHSLSDIKGICSRAAWLEHGQIKAIGPATEVADRYASTFG
jgi:ABC-2 type transport system ATP-binding protein